MNPKKKITGKIKNLNATVYFLRNTNIRKMEIVAATQGISHITSIPQRVDVCTNMSPNLTINTLCNLLHVVRHLIH